MTVTRVVEVVVIEHEGDAVAVEAASYAVEISSASVQVALPVDEAPVVSL